MRHFDYTKLKDCSWDTNIINLLTAIHEEKGKQQLYLKHRPQELEKFVEIAKVQSTEASNEIEGIRTTDTRLRQLMKDKTTPRNRDEEEIQGYRDALNVVHESFEFIPLTPSYILQLHKIMMSHTGSSFGGQFKNAQNYISAVDAEGKTFTLFTPPAPYETPTAIEELCEEYNRAIGEGFVDPLILIPTFIHDFLCIHPFIDGNGRMSRLLTTLLLYRSGHYIGKYISLEAKIAKNKDGYYDSLYDAQIGWHEGKDDPVPFIEYLLGTIVSAYRDFEERAELISGKKTSLDIVRETVDNTIGKFTKTNILERCPSLSSATIERNLKKLCEEGVISKNGQGKSTYYIKVEN